MNSQTQVSQLETYVQEIELLRHPTQKLCFVLFTCLTTSKNYQMQQKYQQYFSLNQNDIKEEASNKIEILNSQTIQLGLIVKNLQNELKERKCGEENEQMMGQVIIEQDVVIKEMMAENQQLKFKLGQKDLQDVVK
ncbi:Hypothetical_protein [Hexamita inflata]|uniref:Hypothetical_protein n=1 Tax=Hexamita inflata TaxID=28002 RepID=A0AA86QY51_9EUKA|nr:Hypothetical protein HINF_LOCUS49583 [Hexamita inflata]